MLSQFSSGVLGFGGWHLNGILRTKRQQSRLFYHGVPKLHYGDDVFFVLMVLLGHQNRIDGTLAVTYVTDLVRRDGTVPIGMPGHLRVRANEAA